MAASRGSIWARTTFSSSMTLCAERGSFQKSADSMRALRRSRSWTLAG